MVDSTVAMPRKSVAKSRCALCGAKEVSEPRGEEKYCPDCWDKKIAVEEIVARDMLEVLPLTHIRGRSLHDTFVIVDEAQSLERNVLLTVLSRIGRDSRVVLTHDVAQRDNLRVGRHDGVVAVIETLKGHPLFAHMTLKRSERSAVAAQTHAALSRVWVSTNNFLGGRHENPGKTDRRYRRRRPAHGLHCGPHRRRIRLR